MTSGIYKIQNKITKYKYIGSSKHIESRWKGHVRWLNRNDHDCPHLQHAWNKYGQENFTFSIVAICVQEELMKIEQYYLDTMRKLYNASLLAHCPESTPEIRKQRSVRAKKQHKAGTIGVRSWKTDPKEAGRKMAATRRKNNSFYAPAWEWTKERKVKVGKAMKERRAKEKRLGLPLPTNLNYYEVRDKRLKELGLL